MVPLDTMVYKRLIPDSVGSDAACGELRVSMGPIWDSNPSAAGDPARSATHQRDAYERISDWLRRLGFGR